MIKYPEECLGCHKPLAYTSLLHVEHPVWTRDSRSHTYSTTCIHCGEFNNVTEAKLHAVHWTPGTGKSGLMAFDNETHPPLDLTATYRQRHVFGRNTELHYEGDGSGWTPLEPNPFPTPPDTLMIPPSLASLNDVYTSFAETEKRMQRMMGINFGEFRTLDKQEQLRLAYGGLPYFGKMEA